jgi:guanylate kinase
MDSLPHDRKIILITAPSGSGKSTLVRFLLQRFPLLRLSVSACTRAPRPNEEDGVHYYFLTEEDFRERIRQDEFVEYEEVYPGKLYGTLREELVRIWNAGSIPILDVDVQGALRIKKDPLYTSQSLFIMPPSLEELERRLRLRNTETEASLQERLAKADDEMQYASRFDDVVVNDNLEQCCSAVEKIIDTFVS